MKRYNRNDDVCLVVAVDGELVKYSDVEKLQQTAEKLLAALKKEHEDTIFFRGNQRPRVYIHHQHACHVCKLISETEEAMK